MEIEEYPVRETISHFNGLQKGYSKGLTHCSFKYNIYLDAFWHDCETLYLAVLYSYHKCEPVKWHIKGNCRMVDLVIATVRRQVSGSGYENPAFEFMPSRSKVRPNLNQQPF